MSLRATTIKKIENELDSSELSKHMFEIVSDENNLLKIIFKLNTDFLFSISEKSKVEMTDGTIQAGFRDPINAYSSSMALDIAEELSKPRPAKTIYYYESKEAPGDLSASVQRYESDALQSALNRIALWVSRVYEDIKVPQTSIDELDMLRKEMESTINSSGESSSVAFEDSEKENLYSQLEALKGKLESLYSEQKESASTIGKMKEQLTKLQGNIGVLDKRTWRLNSFNKIFILVSKAVKFKKNIKKLKENVFFLLSDESIEQLSEETEKGEESNLENE